MHPVATADRLESNACPTIAAVSLVLINSNRAEPPITATLCGPRSGILARSMVAQFASL